MCRKWIAFLCMMEAQWCKLPKRLFSSRSFPKMFVKIAVDGSEKSGYDNIRIVSYYVKL